MSSPRPLILALAPDLWFLTRLRDAAAALGATVEPVRRADQLAARAALAGPALVVIDMATPGQDWAGAIRDLKRAPTGATIPVVAFGPHVDRDSQAAARAAGADRVLSNQRFTETLPQVLAAYLPTQPAP